MADGSPKLVASFESLSVREISFHDAGKLERTPCFALYLVAKGSGSVRVDFAVHQFAAPTLLCLSPYQRAALSPQKAVQGKVLHFHANFFCIETHHHAVGCNGVLFNEVYEIPLVALDDSALAEFQRLMDDIECELRLQDVAHGEALVSSLKILLIKATRLKLAQQGPEGLAATRSPELLRRLRELLELHYRSEHRPSEYARQLGISLKTLAQAVKAHLHRTLSELIRDRVLKHAKWQLLHTLKPVKEVAREVGFEDEFYFSRVFKRAFGLSPLAFREQETALRGGSNLSM